ncbi:MAG TPA: hypothetical protein VFI29_01485 [Hanamia sp.]|nr:hypothetical protein [Hanamia sp.]
MYPIAAMNREADNKAYLVTMTRNTKVQFVLFETILSVEPFMKRWKEYTRSSKSDADVILQQSDYNGGFRYIAQHRFASEEVQFVFTKEKRSSRIAQELIKSNKAGGYSILQAEQLTDAGANERKVFAFISDPRTDLTVYKDLSRDSKLNIYEPYYQNCKFAYILEYFVNTKQAEGLVEQLKNLDATDVAIYRECKIPKNGNDPVKENEFYVWPSF